MKLKLITLLALSAMVMTSSASEMTVKIPDVKILNKHLNEAGLSDFAADTVFTNRLANNTLKGIVFVQIVDESLLVYNKNIKNDQYYDLRWSLYKALLKNAEYKWVSK